MYLLSHRRRDTTHKPPRPARVRILSSQGTERVPTTGAVTSVQEAEIFLRSELLEQVWRPENLELIARGYWAFLRRISLGLIRVVYAPDSRTVVFLSERLPLLRFGTPDYETGDDRAAVTWPIDRGVLVAREGHDEGHLRVEIEREVETAEPLPPGEVALLARVEVRNFYPGLRGRGRFARLGAWLYAQTQLRIHVIVCNAYLRSLPRLDFPTVDLSSLPPDDAAHPPREPVLSAPARGDGQG